MECKGEQRITPLPRRWQRGEKKGVIFIYINKCDVQFGVLIFTISVWVVPDIVVMTSSHHSDLAILKWGLPVSD